MDEILLPIGERGIDLHADIMIGSAPMKIARLQCRRDWPARIGQEVAQIAAHTAYFGLVGSSGIRWL